MKDNTKSLIGLFEVYESFSNNEYDASKCLHYSILKDIYYNPNVLIEEKEVVEKEWLTFGTLVDLMLTDPNSIESKIKINDFVPSDQFKAIADYIVANNIDIYNLEDSQVETIYSETGSMVNWRPETKKQKLLDNCVEYVKLLKDNSDKIIVSSALYKEAEKLATVLKTHRWTSHLFIDKNKQKELNLEILYQFKIKYVFEGVNCKSKIDIIVIDHNNKKIYPYDIKTGNDYPNNFIKSAIYKYKYCYQAVLYREGLKNFVKQIKGFEDYNIEEFSFVYISRIVPDYPIILKIGLTLHNEIRLYGIDTEMYDIPALNEIMEATKFYLGKLDEGEKTLEPYYLVNSFGEVTAINNN